MINTFYHLTKVSSNAKTGPMPVSTTSANTCPSNCSLNGNGCYASSGPSGIHWSAVSKGKRGTNLDGFLQELESLPRGIVWRMNQAGDLPALQDNLINQKALAGIVQANSKGDKKGFTYTHYPVLSHNFKSLANRKAIRDANQQGFVINLSAESYSEADSMLSLSIAPVVTLQALDAKLIEYTPKGHKVITCPATYKDDVSCYTCRLCAIPLDKRKNTIIGFPVHGTSKAKALSVFTQKTGKDLANKVFVMKSV